MARWSVKVKRFDGDEGHVDTWITTVEAKTEEAAEDAALNAYAVSSGVVVRDDSSFTTRAERVRRGRSHRAHPQPERHEGRGGFTKSLRVSFRPFPQLTPEDPTQ